MWSYVGIKQDRTHLERGCALLDQLYLANASHDLSQHSIEQIQLFYAIQTAQLIGHSSRAQQGINTTHPPRFSPCSNGALRRWFSEIGDEMDFVRIAYQHPEEFSEIVFDLFKKNSLFLWGKRGKIG